MYIILYVKSGSGAVWQYSFALHAYTLHRNIDISIKNVHVYMIVVEILLFFYFAQFSFFSCTYSHGRDWINEPLLHVCVCWSCAPHQPISMGWIAWLDSFGLPYHFTACTLSFVCRLYPEPVGPFIRCFAHTCNIFLARSLSHRLVSCISIESWLAVSEFVVIIWKSRFSHSLSLCLWSVAIRVRLVWVCVVALSVYE